MTPAEIRRIFRNASDEVVALNSRERASGGDSVRLRGALEQLPEQQIPPDSESGKVVDEILFGTHFPITISGQVAGGKNNMIVTRTGLHFPKKSWAKWRDEKVAEVRAQLPRDWSPITVPTNIELEYVAGDKRRRDMPAIIDAIYHVLEKAGVVADDTLLWINHSARTYDKANPRATIKIPMP